jgi:hypothetical protein
LLESHGQLEGSKECSDTAEQDNGILAPPGPVERVIGRVGRLRNQRESLRIQLERSRSSLLVLLLFFCIVMRTFSKFYLMIGAFV